MENLKFPSLCACCGSSKVASSWIVSSHKRTFSNWTWLTAPFGVTTYWRTTYTFELPVCRACREKLERIERITTGITRSTVIGCGGIIGIGFMALTAMGKQEYPWIMNLLFAVPLAFLGAYFGRVIGKLIVWVIEYLTVYDFCGFDGKYFHFDNKKFENQFALLNPGWVKRKSKWF